ncbi:hypothetical protein Val02_08580 [Virgisporangium aliadipatigenens]|uniref:Uncharacterized protein n=1 Tax=Virgisporangium aliadipatigenens TaxID=741659 RepID=A0A8J3YGT0_9ACTN|nr:DUF2461 family protein [Virgisporangium aliadipatigenens]GIJ43972.1 hypothetical protein Val02_08580 [Virgisporangium aliadipatigenens]
MRQTGEDLFWELVEPMYADPAVRRSTMMGMACVRLGGRFFASLERSTGALLVKLPAERVAALVAAGQGEPFAPAGRVFREWVALPRPDRPRWRALLEEARKHAGGQEHTGGFAGFGRDGLEFLAGLEHDNTKRFFDAHHDVYRRELLEPAKAFVAAIGPVLRRRVSAELRAEPRVGGSLFRIANDLRFARDRPPYKAHVDFAFWEGTGGPRRDPALILRIAPAEVHLGAGAIGLTGAALESYRTALHDTGRIVALDRQVTALLADGAELSEPNRRRTPAGFDPTAPAAQYAVRDSFHITRRLPQPAEITSCTFVEWCVERFAPFAPVQQWMTEVMATTDQRQAD